MLYDLSTNALSGAHGGQLPPEHRDQEPRAGGGQEPGDSEEMRQQSLWIKT